MTFTPVTTITVVPTKNRSRRIEVLHTTADPCAWKVRLSKIFLLFRWKSKRIWFSDYQQALRFARAEAEKTEYAG